MKTPSILALLLALSLTSQAHAEALVPGSILDLAPLFKESVASNAGIEMVHPYLDQVDADGDGVMDSVNLRFNVYPADSTTRLFGTPTRRVDFPRPCTNPGDYRWSEISAIKFLGGDTPRSHLTISLAAGCIEADAPYDYKEAYKTVVYSAAVDAPAGSVWQKAYNGAGMSNFDEVNVDGDADKELVLGLLINRPDLSDGAKDLRTNALDASDGAVVFQVTRILTR